MRGVTEITRDSERIRGIHRSYKYYVNLVSRPKSLFPLIIEATNLIPIPFPIVKFEATMPRIQASPTELVFYERTITLVVPIETIEKIVTSLQELFLFIHHKVMVTLQDPSPSRIWSCLEIFLGKANQL